MEIKICGLRRPEDARLAVRLGAQWIGVVRAPDSPRSATLEEARQVIAAAREVNPEVRPVLATGRRTRDEVASDAFALGVERGSSPTACRTPASGRSRKPASSCTGS